MRWWMALPLVSACASAGTGGAPDIDANPNPPVDAKVVDAHPDAMPVDLCPSAATCQTALTLGTVSGDTGNAKLSAMGTQSAWFRVRVTENDNNAPGLTLRVGAKLTSPSAVDFDVFVYVNVGSDVIECSTTVGTTTTTGTINEDRAEWGEGFVPNGSDDSRNVSIEVRPIAGSCSAAQQWQLDIEGNWI
jgi:hypothetical protein